MRIFATALVLLFGGVAIMGEEDELSAPAESGKADRTTEVAEILILASVLRGKIGAIELARWQFAVKTEDSKEKTVSVEASTPIELNDKEAKLADLRTGDEAFVVYKERDGKTFALSVRCARK